MREIHYVMKNPQRVTSFEEACAQTGRPKLKILFCILRLIIKSKADWLYAYYKMSVITEALNGDWEADWSDRHHFSYAPLFYNYDGFECYRTDFENVPRNAGYTSRLVFKDEETAEYAGKQFLSIWKTIILG